MQPLSGRDQPVAEFVLARGGRQALACMAALLDLSLPLHAQEGRALVTIAIGCTGGQHRSVALAEALADHVRPLRLGRVTVNHRNARFADAPAPVD